MGKKIVISMTFRSFDGSINAKIQRMFLQSLTDQTYQNFVIAVTIFGETGVPETLKETGLPHTIHYAEPGDYKKFSLSKVLLNGIKISKEQNEDCILLWINADNMLESNFLERIAHVQGEKIGGISYPHQQYRSIADYQAKRGATYGWYGIDSAFFSRDVFDEQFIEVVKQYPNNDYLYFEAFVVALATVFCNKRVNMYPAGYSTIANDYVAIGQTSQSTKETGKKNMAELKKFMRDFNLLDNNWYSFILNYKLTGKNILKVWWMRLRIFVQITYAGSYIRRAMPKIKRLLKITT